MGESNDAILEAINRLTRLVAGVAVLEKDRRTQIHLLSTAGLPPKEIAEIIGTTPNTVSVELSKMRKEGKVRAYELRRPEGKPSNVGIPG